MEKTIIYHDFDDTEVAKIYCLRFIETAKILEIGCCIDITNFGINKVHVKMELSGDSRDIAMFQDFVDTSLALIDSSISTI